MYCSSSPCSTAYRYSRWISPVRANSGSCPLVSVWTWSPISSVVTGAAVPLRVGQVCQAAIAATAVAPAPNRNTRRFIDGSSSSSPTSLLQEPLDQPPCPRRAPIAFARDPTDDPPITVDEHRAGVATHAERRRCLARRIEPHREADPEVRAPFSNSIGRLAKAHADHGEATALEFLVERRLGGSLPPALRSPCREERQQDRPTAEGRQARRPPIQLVEPDVRRGDGRHDSQRVHRHEQIRLSGGRTRARRGEAYEENCHDDAQRTGSHVSPPSAAWGEPLPPRRPSGLRAPASTAPPHPRSGTRRRASPRTSSSGLPDEPRTR